MDENLLSIPSKISIASHLKYELLVILMLDEILNKYKHLGVFIFFEKIIRSTGNTNKLTTLIVFLYIHIMYNELII